MLAALLVPQGMAYGALAGLPPVTGLYATLVPLVVYFLLGPSRILVLGPDSAVSPLVAAAILMGVLPTLFLRPMEPSVTRVVQRVTQSQRVNVRALPATPGARVRAHQAASGATTAAASEVGLR